jgi:hypothetical protein
MFIGACSVCLQITPTHSPKFQLKTKKENMGFCHPPKTHKNNTFKLGDPTLKVLSLVEASKAFCYAHQLFFPFVLLWVKIYEFVVWLSFLPLHFEWNFLHLLYDSVFLPCILCEKLCICCMTLFLCLAFCVKNYAFVVWLCLFAFAFVLLWVKNYAFVVWLCFFAFAFTLLWVKIYEFVVWLCFFAFAFMLLWMKIYAFVVWLCFFAFAFALLWVKNICFCLCMTLLLPLHSRSYEWKIMHLLYDFVFFDNGLVFILYSQQGL